MAQAKQKKAICDLVALVGQLAFYPSDFQQAPSRIRIAWLGEIGAFLIETADFLQFAGTGQFQLVFW